MNYIYKSLNGNSFLKKSYSLKFLFVAFLGTHIPLIGIIIFIVSSKESVFSSSTTIILTLLFTLVAAIFTITILNKLLEPLHLSKKALEDYLLKDKLPNLPLDFVDEAGVLMSLINKTLYAQDALIKEKQEIITLVSHNLRTPLNQIIGLCDLMKYDDEDKSLYIDKVSKISHLQLDSLTDLLKQLMHHDAGTTFYSEEYDIRDLIEQEIEMIDLIAKKKGIQFVFNKPEAVFKSKLNKNKVALVLQNLISNAIKFSFEHSKIEINLKVVEGKYQISVKDTGIGFDEEYRNQLFKDTRKVGRKGTNEEPSIGLGLHLSKRTIGQLGGNLTAYSDGPNKGATFTISF